MKEDPLTRSDPWAAAQVARSGLDLEMDSMMANRC